jgi:hypothetical protein
VGGTPVCFLSKFIDHGFGPDIRGYPDEMASYIVMFGFGMGVFFRQKVDNLT